MGTQEEVQQQYEVGEAVEAVPEGLALAQALLLEWWAGVQDATRFGAAKDILTESSTVRRLTTKCVAITSAFLAAYTLSLSYVALPFCERLAGVSGDGEAGHLASSLSIMILVCAATKFSVATASPGDSADWRAAAAVEAGGVCDVPLPLQPAVVHCTV